MAEVRARLERRGDEELLDLVSEIVAVAPHDDELAALVAMPESDGLERKSSFEWDIVAGKRNKDRNFDVAEAVAGSSMAKEGRCSSVLLMTVRRLSNR